MGHPGSRDARCPSLVACIHGWARPCRCKRSLRARLWRCDLFGRFSGCRLARCSRGARRLLSRHFPRIGACRRENPTITAASRHPYPHLPPPLPPLPPLRSLSASGKTRASFPLHCALTWENPSLTTNLAAINPHPLGSFRSALAISSALSITR